MENTFWKYLLKIIIENNFRDLAAFTFFGIPLDTKFFYIFVYIVFTTGIPLEENDVHPAIGQAHDMFSWIFRIRIYEFFLSNTGCPVNWYSLSISIPDFSDGPIKKI